MPNDVGCPICGKRYFPHSLKIHLPQCQRKWASVEVPCPRCASRRPRDFSLILHLTPRLRGDTPSPRRRLDA